MDKVPESQRQVIFLDELPWMATAKSGFLTGLEFFWNSWAVKKNVVVVICGSAASWMIQKVVNNTGGLYNRVTKRIFLQPFSLSETRSYFQSKHLHFDNYQITHIYMAMGGIPHYLKEVEAGKSAVQNIDHICFSKNGLLHTEFVKHIPQIKKALGISGVYSKSSSFYKKGIQGEKGTQIDLLIDRNDHVINVFEIKFYNTQFSINEAYAKVLRDKLRIFKEQTQTRKYLMPSLITTFGLKHNQHSLGLIEKVISLDQLFED